MKVQTIINQYNKCIWNQWFRMSTNKRDHKKKNKNRILKRDCHSILFRITLLMTCAIIIKEFILIRYMMCAQYKFYKLINKTWNIHSDCKL